MEGPYPLNRVRAAELQAQLQAEYSGEVWRRAIEAARQRWLEEGHKIERVTSRTRQPKISYIYE